MIHIGKRLAAQSSWMNQQVDFYLVEYVGHSNTLARAKVTFEEAVQDGLPIEPTFSLTRDIAQELFEQMWAQGFRSANDKGSADRVDAARQEHIADLRKVAKIT